MLVCNVSLRPPRRAIAADVIEVGAAVDDPATGNIVFATLVDDPASVAELVDAYLGELMVEAASAADVVDVAFDYAAAVDETATALDVQNATVGGAVVAREAMVVGQLPVFVNSSTVSREASVNGVMVNV